MIKIKRIYEKQYKEDGYRILMDRLWARGLTKEKAGVDLWLKEIVLPINFITANLFYRQ